MNIFSVSKSIQCRYICVCMYACMYMVISFFSQRDPDCEPLYGNGFVCEDQLCVEAPDPCDPTPCGPGAESTPSGNTCQCTCPSGFLGDPHVECIQVFLNSCH